MKFVQEIDVIFIFFSGGGRGGRFNDNRGGYGGSDRFGAPGKDRFDSGNDRFQNNRRGGGGDRGGRGRPFGDRAGGSRTPQDRGRFNSNPRNDFQAPKEPSRPSNDEEENWDDDLAGAVPSRPSTQQERSGSTPQYSSNNSVRNDYQNTNKNRSNDDEENWDDDLAPAKSPAVHSVSTPKTNTSPKSMTMSGDQTPLWDED